MVAWCVLLCHSQEDYLLIENLQNYRTKNENNVIMLGSIVRVGDYAESLSFAT